MLSIKNTADKLLETMQENQEQKQVEPNEENKVHMTIYNFQTKQWMENI